MTETRNVQLELFQKLCRLNANVNEECASGMRENVHHFLLECTRYKDLRKRLITTTREVWGGVIDENVLPSESGVKLTLEQWKVVIEAVADYVLQTKRKI